MVGLGQSSKKIRARSGSQNLTVRSMSGVNGAEILAVVVCLQLLAENMCCTCGLCWRSQIHCMVSTQLKLHNNGSLVLK